ncbi:MAG: hypothetical protein HQL51_01885 [Magnetococcales bacterium]|nr:hypothetical protein [Magnetococcales bacterium]
MAKSILLVDPFRGTRALVRSYLQSELGEVILVEADSLDRAAALSAGRSFDLAIWSDRLPGIDRLLSDEGGGAELLRLRRSCPFLVLFHTPQRPERIARFALGGLTHGLPSPFTPEELAARVEALTPSRPMRATPRLSAPDSRVSLRLGDLLLEGELINVSLGGFLCELVWDVGDESRESSCRRWDAILSPARLEAVAAGLHFPPELGGVSLEGLSCQWVALRVMSRLPDGRLERLRLRWQWIDPPLPRLQEVEAIIDRWRAATLAAWENDGAAAAPA